MITIYLQGELADYFTPQITVAVSSVAEAIAALKANFKDFAKITLVDDSIRVICTIPAIV